MKKLCAQPFQLIATDRGQDPVDSSFQITVQEGLRQGPHGTLYDGIMMPETSAALKQARCREEARTTPGELAQLRKRCKPIRRLVEPLAAALEQLIGTDHQRVGP